MGQLQIIIPTRGRKNEQLTVQNLPKELMQRTTVVCPQKDYGAIRGLREDFNVVVQPDNDMWISPKREWINQQWLKWGYDKVIHLDDDLRFATRKSKDDWHLRPMTSEELLAEFQRMEDKLGPEFPHVGFAQRQGNNTIEEAGWKSPGKQVCTLGYYLPVAVKELNWHQVLLRGDMCSTLQLLLKGYPNAIWTETVHDQRAFDAPGGCNTYRTIELLNSEAEKFAGLYPQYVSIADRKYDKKTRISKQKDTANRLEIIVQWQKALEEGQRVRNQCRQYP